MKKYKKVIIIDDDYTNNVICEKNLMNAQIAEEVLSFLNVVDGLNYLKDCLKDNQLPDLLLLDIYFPLEDGWDFMIEFEKIFSNSTIIPDVYMLTSSIANMDMQQAKSNSLIKGLMIKPLTEEKLIKNLG